MKSVLAMIVVGLTPRHLGVLTPRLSALAREGAMASLQTVTPAVTCSVQASFMTGLTPREHPGVHLRQHVLVVQHGIQP